MAPRISVLLPTHNRADILPFAIKSVLAQTERDFELLIVGDGCTDQTAEIVAGFSDQRIRWFDLPKAPHFGYANRNVALRQARGELIAYAAHDDLLVPDHLAALSQRLAATNSDWIYSRPIFVSPDGVLVPLAGNLHNADELEFFLTRGSFVPMACVMHRRTSLVECGYWPEDLPAKGDWHLWRRMIEHGARRAFAYQPTPTVLHFKARRKTSLAPPVAALVKLAHTMPWWPAALKVAVGSHATEQAALSERLTNLGSTWVDEVRQAVAVVIERLAADHTARCLHPSHAVPAETASLKHLVSYREYQLVALAAQLKAAIDQSAAAAVARVELPPPEFVERDYLDANPDVAAAVARGEYPSGFDHWIEHGWRECRSLRAEAAAD
jgi:hypothetical protein